MLSTGKNHFGLDPICGKYSRIHRCQTCLVSSWILRQRFLRLKGVLSTLSGTKSPPICPIRKWFGVNTRSSFGSSLTVVRGYPLLPAIRTNALRNASVSKDDANSRWQQWVCRQRNKHKYRFARTLPRPCLVK